MSLPEIVTRDEWLAARTALLEQEKELTRRRDELGAERRRLPMVEITEDYRFTAADGSLLPRTVDAGTTSPYGCTLPSIFET